jgi:predicted metal-dependent HD superfamily phosphohydrolase
MTIWLDPPAWPAHGTLWSHLVSDSSLHELRSFARAQGVGDRAFDLDHYDVPAERHDDLVAAGAVPVTGGELSRRLAGSVLRVPGWERRRAARDTLLARWAALWETGDGSRAAVAAAGQDLVDRWREPHRVYHSRLHLADSLDALDRLVAEGAAGSAWHAAVALWFHDAVHAGEAGRDEERSAALAAELLGPLAGTARPAGRSGPLTARDVAEVARLVLVTTAHDPTASDASGALVSDADLAVLGADPGRYARYAAQVRAEYGHVPDGAFRAGRAAVLDQLMGLPHLFRSPAAAALWGEAARRNLRAEHAALDGGSP